MTLLYAFSFSLILIGIILLFLAVIFDKKKQRKLKKHRNDKYAILIPARDESKVIEGE